MWSSCEMVIAQPLRVMGRTNKRHKTEGRVLPTVTLVREYGSRRWVEISSLPSAPFLGFTNVNG